MAQVSCHGLIKNPSNLTLQKSTALCFPTSTALTKANLCANKMEKPIRYYAKFPIDVINLVLVTTNLRVQTERKGTILGSMSQVRVGICAAN